MRETYLIIAPHCDDEFFSCMSLFELAYNKGADVVVAVATYGERQSKRATVYPKIKEEVQKLFPDLNYTTQFLNLFPDGCPPINETSRIVMTLDNLLVRLQPTCIAIPSVSHHQDHVYLHDCCVAALRQRASVYANLREVISYEYMYNRTGINSEYYVPMSDTTAELKFKILGKILAETDVVLNDRSVNSVNYLSLTMKADGVECSAFVEESNDTLNTECFKSLYRRENHERISKRY